MNEEYLKQQLMMQQHDQQAQLTAANAMRASTNSSTVTVKPK